MRNRGLVLATTVLAALVLVGCGSQPWWEDEDDTSVGMGVPRRGAQEFAQELAQAPRTVRSRVHVAHNGCFLGSLPRDATTRYLVVWPADTELGASGGELVLPDGTTVGDGDVVVGAAVPVPTRRLEGFGQHGYWDHAVGYCTPEAAEVLVLDPA